MKYIKIKNLILILVLFLSLNLRANANDITNNNFELVPNNYQQLREKIKEFTFFHLDNNDTNFSVIVTGKVLNNFTYKGFLNTTSEFEAPIIEQYMKTIGKDYNALNLRQYTVRKTVWNDGINIEKLNKFKLSFDIVWADSKDEVGKIDQFVKETVNKLINEEDDSYSKLLALHRFVVDNYQYDTNKDSPIHDTYELIINKKGVCSAYTGLFHKLIIQAGFNARIIINNAYATDKNGTSSSHAWNLVELGGKYYHIDVTWDDPVTPFNINSPNLKYFLKSDAFMENDHSWNRDLYEKANEKFNFNSMLNIGVEIFEPIINVSSKIKNELQNKANNYELLANKPSNINFWVYLVGVLAFLYLFISISLLFKKKENK